MTVVYLSKIGASDEKASAQMNKVKTSKTRSKRTSQTLLNNGKSAKRVPAAGETVKRYGRSDSAGRFVESANEHMLRAWESIHVTETTKKKRLA